MILSINIYIIDIGFIDMVPYGFIYITTNRINEKKYIGQCSLHRRNCKSYLGSGKVLKRAIAKYGRENFSREIICYCFSKNDMNIVEELIIKEYDAVLDKCFYNLLATATATNGFKGKKHTKEWKKSRSEFGKTRPATEKMRANMRKVGKMPKTDKQIAASKITGRKIGLANGKPKEYKMYTCLICQEGFKRVEYVHHPLREGLCCSPKCASKKSIKTRKDVKQIQINGEIFIHAAAAAKKLNINYHTIIGRLKSDNFNEYIYIK